MLADLGVLQCGVGGRVGMGGLGWGGGFRGGGRVVGRGSFLSGDGLRYGSRWDHVQQVLSLPVC